jgi:signal transduction histidine kinase
LTSLPAFLSAYLNAEPLRLTRPEATFHAGAADELAFVVDGVAAGPRGWSPAPKVSEPQALVVRCERPVEANELEINLFFLAGRPWNALAEFSLSFTTDSQPSLRGNWQPLEINRFAAEVGTLRRTDGGRLHLDFFERKATGNQPDDVYHVEVRLPGGRATGFRLEVFPVPVPEAPGSGLSWWAPHDFSLTEFRVAVHVRETTNIALHQPVTSSHPVFEAPPDYRQSPSSLTDGLPATAAHPHDPALGSEFYFEIDLGRTLAIDHINLRNRGDFGTDRMSRLKVRLYDRNPATAADPVWEGLNRADGSHPNPGAVDAMRENDGAGGFRGRYLRLSSDSSVPHSPQLAEVEVYESRTPVLVAVSADGKPLEPDGSMKISPGARRLSLILAIPQSGKPAGDAFRWRLLGDFADWQSSSQMTIDMACPPAGEYVFEAQAMHSDGEWDTTLYHLPILVRQHWWKSGWFRWTSGFLTTGLAIGIGMLWSRRRAARQLTRMKAENALAEERARIARDLHDEIGANLTHISILSTLASEAATGPETSRQHNAEVASCARETIQAFDEILWSVNPKNDTLPSLCHYVCRRTEEMLSPAGLTYRFNVQDPMPDLPLPPNSRHQLLLAVKETLHNIIKHAQARHVHVRCELEDHRSLRIGIQDDGCGFDPSSISPNPAQRRGMGLEDIRHRLTSLGGECHIESTPGQGTRVTLLLPL